MAADDYQFDSDIEGRIEELLLNIRLNMELILTGNCPAIAEAIIREVIPVSSARDSVMFKMRYLDERIMTLQEIGDKFGLTRERVRQTMERILSRLRHPARRKRLRAGLLRFTKHSEFKQLERQVILLQQEVTQLKARLAETSN